MRVLTLINSQHRRGVRLLQLESIRDRVDRACFGLPALHTGLTFILVAAPVSFLGKGLITHILFLLILLEVFILLGGLSIQSFFLMIIGYGYWSVALRGRELLGQSWLWWLTLAQSLIIR